MHVQSKIFASGNPVPAGRPVADRQHAHAVAVHGAAQPLEVRGAQLLGWYSVKSWDFTAVFSNTVQTGWYVLLLSKSFSAGENQLFTTSNHWLVQYVLHYVLWTWNQMARTIRVVLY